MPLITSEINYDENANTISKTYSNGLSFSVAYDDKGNIISNERNSYVYDKYGELIQTTGAVNSSYTYDGRGNLLTKTVSDETTEFEYDSEWLDQLTSVDGVSLTYDIMGNLLTYGDAEYTWSHGRQLDSITDGENSYSYTYDTNGIRASKTVNGRSIQYNVLGSKILAEDGVNGEIYFQYSGDELIGFYLNDVQYFYIKNLNGDIVGITDYDGNLIAEYEYDEWGKLLNITTAEEGNEEQLKIATANPFRYRGYYYDNETGYYYLHSRYYNPEWGRFISADDLNYINNSKSVNLNAYCYCANNPIRFKDPTGNELTWNTIGDIIGALLIFDQISIDMSSMFGKDLANNFFEFLGELFSIVPSLTTAVLEVVKAVPEYIWEVFRDNVHSINIGDVINDLAISFSTSFIRLANDATISASKNFLTMLSTWSIGYLPLQLLILAPGIILDDTLTSSQKFTLLFLDSFSIIASEAIAIINTIISPSKIVGGILDVLSFLLPITTDLISRILMKKGVIE